MAEFWLLSVPGTPYKEAVIAKTNEGFERVAQVFPISLPEIKVGTLDALMLLSDELIKSDASLEATVTKTADTLKNLLHGDPDAWAASLVVAEKPIPVYLKGFSWNLMKYRVDKSLKEIHDAIMADVASIDTLMKAKTTAYSQAKGLLQSLQRKTVGNLAVKSLNEIVKKEYFVLDSEYLTTILVAVPKSKTTEWLATYETLTQMVVPRSATKIAEDDEYVLYTTTLFQRVVDEFTQKARDLKFIVRDFKWDAEALLQDKKQAAEAFAAEREQWTTLVRLSKTNFGELYACWIHIKCLRVFVESILRYGLPPNFQPMILKALPKQESKVKETINAHYAYLDSSGRSGKHDDVIEDGLAHLVDKDYSPVVVFPIHSVS